MRYLLKNAPMQTTGAPAPVTTGTAIKTLLQVKAGATNNCHIVEWGICFDGSASAIPIKCELIETDVAGTVTAFVANDVIKYDGPALLAGDPTTSNIAVGTTSSGYTCTSEGTITAVRDLDGPQLVAPTNQYVKQFPLGERPMLQAGKFLRVRVTAGTAVNAYCYVILEA